MRNSYENRHIKKFAKVSNCGNYRYELQRSWFSKDEFINPCVFIMLSPSSIDPLRDDRTVLRCMGFAKKFGYNQIKIVNLFALCVKKSDYIYLSHDPIGKLNNLSIIDACEYTINPKKEKRLSGKIICAWGAAGPFQQRANDVAELLSSYPLYCLGVTDKEKHPKHPLYLPNCTELQPYSPI